MAVLATDNFNRANGGLGANWTTGTGTAALSILSNTCLCNGDPQSGWYDAATWPNNQYAQVILKTMVAAADNGIGPMVRQAAAADTRYFAIGNSVDSRIYKVVTGTYTQIGATGAACVTNDILYLEAQGTAIVAKKNGSNVVSTTDSAITAGNAGIFGANEVENPTCDDFEGGDFGAAAGLAKRSRLAMQAVNRASTY